MKHIVFFLLIVLGTCFISCKEKPIDDVRVPSLVLQFNELFEGADIAFDTMQYFSEAGNPFYITEIKYFISNICLYKGGQKIKISYQDGLHYVETNYPDTKKWNICQSLAKDNYDSIGFTFGLTDAINITNAFPNSPENSMTWPTILGGGYHYMMLNGKYLYNDTLYPMNIHLGRGQIYQSQTPNTDSIIGFIDNSFKVTLPYSFSFNGSTQTININMNVENWFKEPFVYDIAYWGSSIMQNQAAMQMLKENGTKNVFTIY